MKHQTGILTDTSGASHVTADHSRHLFELCDRLKRNKRSIRWNLDLNAYELVLRSDEEKRILRQWYAEVNRSVRRSRAVV